MATSSLSGLTDRIDNLLESSPPYISALHTSFLQFATPPPVPAIPSEQLLPALQFLLQKLTEQLDYGTGKIWIRSITPEDVAALLQIDNSVDDEHPVGHDLFDKLAKRLLKRMALERGARLGVFTIVGITVVHLSKRAVKRIPFIGPSMGLLLNFLLPTPVLGTAVGMAGAIHL